MNYFEQGLFDLDEAIRAGRIGVQLQPHAPYRWIQLGDQLLAVGELEESLKACQEALRVRKLDQYGGAPVSAAYSLYLLDRRAEAKADLERFFAEGFGGRPFEHQLCWVIAFIEQDHESMQQQALWVEENPGEEGMLLLRIKEAFYEGRFQEGRQLLDDLVVLNRQ